MLTSSLATSPPAIGASAGPSLPDDVRDTLSWLAHLLDATIPLRACERAHGFAQRHLGVGPGAVIAVRERLGAFSAPLVARALAADLRHADPVEIAGEDSDESPVWDRLDLEGATESVPACLVAAFAAGSLSPAPLAVEIETRWDGKYVVVYGRTSDAGHAEAYLQSLLTRARGEENYLRGRCVQVHGGCDGISVSHIPTPATARTEVILPTAVWAEVDLCLAAIGTRRALLTDLGLGTNRGLLLHGPPGTGKSALCRALAAELAGAVTVVFCDAASVSRNLPEVYAEITHLSPALVVLEDLDLVVERRGRGSDAALHGFLTALDGAMSRHEDTVTLATTNHAGALDPAAVRAARFDRLVEVPLPDAAARTAILVRYVGRLAAHVDVRAVGAATAGASGADLRELARRGVLVHGEDLDTRDLLDLARDAGWSPEPTGLYL